MHCLTRCLPTGRPARARAFSLVELVMVVFIIAIIAAIAVPRVSQGSRSAQANAIVATLTSVRAAIDHYYAEHSRYPGYKPSSSAPDGTWFVDQLTKYSDAVGNVSDTLTATFRFGPYLRRPFPKNPLNQLDTVAVKALSTGMVALDSSGWIACLEDGSFAINAASPKLNTLNISADEVVRTEKARGL